MGKVAKLPTVANDKAEEMVPPFTMAITANFADLQQIRIDMPSTDPISRDEANRRIDLLSGLVQRQVSLKEIDANEAALKDKEKALDLQRRRKAEEEAKHAKALAGVEEEITKLLAREEEMRQEGAAEWTRSSRQGDYKPQGATANQLKKIKMDVEAQRAKVKALAAEHEQNVARAQDQMIERLVEEIAAIKRVIEKHRGIVG